MAKILIVDDEPDVRTLLFHTLRSAGHTVVEAPGGEEALRKLRRSKFDLVVLDIMMPVMSGYEVLEKIRSLPSRSTVPVVVVTAKHEPAGVIREVAGGVTDHVAKPFHPTELLATVERALKRSRASVEEHAQRLSRTAVVYELANRLRDGLDEI